MTTNQSLFFFFFIRMKLSGSGCVSKWALQIFEYNFRFSDLLKIANETQWRLAIFQLLLQLLLWCSGSVSCLWWNFFYQVNLQRAIPIIFFWPFYSFYSRLGIHVDVRAVLILIKMINEKIFIFPVRQEIESFIVFKRIVIKLIDVLQFCDRPLFVRSCNCTFLPSFLLLCTEFGIQE